MIMELATTKLTCVQRTAMDSVLADINVDGTNNDVELADVAPRGVRKQEKQKDKKVKKEKDSKVDDKKKRRHSEVNGEVEGEKKKKKRSKV
jgi:nucleolar protein 56